MPDLLGELVAWAAADGPPNWAFAVALLSTPHLWSRYVKRVATRLYERYTGGRADGE